MWVTLTAQHRPPADGGPMTAPVFCQFTPGAHRGDGLKFPSTTSSLGPGAKLSWEEQARFGGQLLRQCFALEDDDEGIPEDSDSEECDTLGQLPVLPLRASPQLVTQVPMESRIKVSDKMTTLRVRSIAGEVLLEMQIGSWNVLSLPMKYFISGRVGLSHTPFDLIFENHLLGLDDKIGKLITDVPEDGIDLLLVRSMRKEEYADSDLDALDEFEDKELLNLGRVPLVRHGVKYRAENSGQL
mmetsp:Transcript_64403/g.141211  ORF Transcript_64403/g.141211 Transcript_64403/m.141211 type:complete len:242 (-) Transcript_64403:35-760(-)